jgi:Tol biopolymer transport system component
MYSAVDRNTGKTKIWTMSPDSSQPIQLTQAADCNDIDACWSPDGKQILFASDRGQANGVQNFDIWLINSDGSNPKQLTTNGSRDDKPIFSKDGKAVYFRSNRGMKWDIWVMELASAGEGK